MAGLLGAVTTRGVQFIEDIPATSRVVNELEEQGCQQAADTTLGGILKVKIVVSDQRRPGRLHNLDVFNNGGANTRYKFSVTEESKNHLGGQLFGCLRT